MNINKKGDKEFYPKNLESVLNKLDGINLDGIFNDSTFDGKKTYNKHINGSKIVSILPFLSREQIDDLVEMLICLEIDIKDLNVVAMAPFLRKQNFVRILDYAYKTDQLLYINVYGLLPFIGGDILSGYVDLYISNDYRIGKLNIPAFYQFLKKNDIDKLFFYMLENNSKLINSIAPFVSPESLHKFVINYLNGRYQNVDINKLYRFLSKDDVRILKNKGGY